MTAPEAVQRDRGRLKEKHTAEGERTEAADDKVVEVNYPNQHSGKGLDCSARAIRFENEQSAT